MGHCKVCYALRKVGAQGQQLSLREAYISNLHLLLSLEPFQSLLWLGGWSNVILEFSLRLKLNNYESIKVCKYARKEGFKHVTMQVCKYACMQPNLLSILSYLSRQTIMITGIKQQFKTSTLLYAFHSDVCPIFLCLRNLSSIFHKNVWFPC